MVVCLHSGIRVWPTMTLGAFVLIYAVFGGALTAADDVTIKSSRFYSPNNDIHGVASVSGITSRNGRVSTVGGVKFYGPDSVAVNINADPSIYYPLTVTAQKDGHFATGSVRVYPGSRGVSSSASAGYMPEGWSMRQLATPPPFLFQPPSQLFEFPKQMDTWFPRNMFRNVPQQRIHVPSNNWMYPSFDPFVNFWR